MHVPVQVEPCRRTKRGDITSGAEFPPLPPLEKGGRPMRLSLFVSLLLAAAVGLSFSPASAGPNQGGTIIAHDLHLFLSATNGSVAMCLQGDDLVSCETADAEIEDALQGTKVFKVYAAFPPESSPQLAEICWGIQYDPSLIHIEAMGMCSYFELHQDLGWPVPPSPTVPANVISLWMQCQTSRLVAVYWFAASCTGPAALQLTPNPYMGGIFCDDSTPSIIDPIAGYGSMGFAAPGETQCYPGQPGACCDPQDGSCRMLNVLECFQAEGIFHGATVACVPDPCPTTGACCNVSGGGQCVAGLTAAACAQLGGYFYGFGTNCNPAPIPCYSMGACCTGATCTYADEGTCVAPAIFLGPLIGCDPQTCAEQLGACCTGTMCRITTEYDCEEGNHIWLAGLSCYPDVTQPCRVQLGACCEGLSCQVLTGEQCPTTAIWVPDVPCTPGGQICATALGACCFEFGLCTLVTEGDCPTGGVWHGGVDCRSALCDSLAGACCFGTDCVVDTPDQCQQQGGIYVGGTCSSNPCSTLPAVGACCYPDGSCEVLIEGSCGGTWLGAGTMCNPDPCTGACCLQTGECVTASPSGCSIAGGVFQGISTLCAPNPCSATAIERASWGMIKARFR
jgi:hypothetical protein